jgi:hypothetical protein
MNTHQELREEIERIEQRNMFRNTAVRTHSEECWQWHIECAVQKIKELMK